MRRCDKCREFNLIIREARSFVRTLSKSDAQILNVVPLYVERGDDKKRSGYYPDEPRINLRWDDFRGQWTQELVRTLIGNYIDQHKAHRQK